MNAAATSRDDSEASRGPSRSRAAAALRAQRVPAAPLGMIMIDLALPWRSLQEFEFEKKTIKRITYMYPTAISIYFFYRYR